MEDVKVGLKIISKEKQRHVTKDKNTVLCFQSLLFIALNFIIYKVDKIHISGKQCFCVFRITVTTRSVSPDIREGLAFYQDENKKLVSMFLMFIFLNYKLQETLTTPYKLVFLIKHVPVLSVSLSYSASVHLLPVCYSDYKLDTSQSTASSLTHFWDGFCQLQGYHANPLDFSYRKIQGIRYCPELNIAFSTFQRSMSLPNP